jgi:hypothetical protein
LGIGCLSIPLYDLIAGPGDLDAVLENMKEHLEGLKRDFRKYSPELYDDSQWIRNSFLVSAQPLLNNLSASEEEQLQMAS